MYKYVLFNPFLISEEEDLPTNAHITISLMCRHIFVFFVFPLFLPDMQNRTDLLLLLLFI